MTQDDNDIVRTCIDDLPDEVLATIVNLTDCTARYSMIPRVSHRWRNVASDRALLGPPPCMHSGQRLPWFLCAHVADCPRHRLGHIDAMPAATLARMVEFTDDIGRLGPLRIRLTLATFATVMLGCVCFSLLVR